MKQHEFDFADDDKDRSVDNEHTLHTNYSFFPLFSETKHFCLISFTLVDILKK